MGGQILGAMPENLAPCFSVREIEFLGSGIECSKRKKALRFTSECFLYIQNKIKYKLCLWLIFAATLFMQHYKYNKT